MLDINFTPQLNCPVCGGAGRRVIDLDSYPITEIYVDWTPEFQRDGLLDQGYRYCDDCCHGYLERILDVRFIYQNYITTSASSMGAKACLKSFAEFIRTYVSVDDFRMMIDIGGNDSTLLADFAASPMKLVNIDPNATGGERFEVIRCFLEDMDLDVYRSEEKKLVVSSHTIEHLARPEDLIRKIAGSLRPGDVCFLQFPSVERLVRFLRFDQICHQHLNYFSINSIEKLLVRHGLKVCEFEYDDQLYGTLRLMVAVDKGGAVEGSRRVRLTGNDVASGYKAFHAYYGRLNDTIAETFCGGTGFGAGLMVPTLAYHLDAVRHLDVIIDESPSKQGKRFINLAPRIGPMADLDPREPVLVTSISTKGTARAIAQKLASLGVQNFVTPTLFW